MKKKWLFTWFLLIVFPVLASHIVGGEFELLHISGNTYRLNMILYFDKVNGDSLALDQNALVYIFRKSDNRLMDSVNLPLTSNTLIAYTQPACATGSLKTAKLIYTKQITLSPSRYDSPQGYYVSWQRCCRNYTIVNIYSQNPNAQNYKGKYGGQTFYLEFPPVIKDGEPFYNSSPRLFPPLSDYAVPNRPYYVDFSGIDDDNDSLVYSLATPMSTTTDAALPDRSSAPYPDVLWKPGYDVNHVVQGNPDLRISVDGLLTVTPPNVQGLFVFAIKVDQYRDNIKIGESRRDFQMYVVDVPLSVPPKIVGKKLADADYTYDGTMTLDFPYTVTDADRCIKVRISDDDSKVAPKLSEFVGIRLVPLNFNRYTSLAAIGLSQQSATLVNGSTQEFTVCFPACPIIPGPMKFGIIAYDDACALPLLDTLIVTVNIHPPPNTPPFFTFVTPQPSQLTEGDSKTMIVEAVDNELDTMSLLAAPDHFALADAGMVLTILESSKGHIKGQLKWDAFCDIYDFTHQTEFPVKIFVDDLDKCSNDAPIHTDYDLTVALPSVADPIIDTDLTADPAEVKVSGLEMHVDESLNFNVTGRQSQADTVFLKGPGAPEDRAAAGVSFLDAKDKGIVTSHFQWDIKCPHYDPDKDNLFQFQFIVTDPNKCRFLKNDTVTVEVKVLPPLNNAPVLTLQSQNALTLENNTMNVTLGQSIALGLFGRDADPDQLSLKLTGASGNVDPEGYQFADTTGVSSVSSPFTWNPLCTIFKESVYSNDYVFSFALKDDKCFNAKGDSVTLHIHIADIESGAENFLPTNVITPNADGCNDFFALEGIDPLPQASGCQALDDPDSFVALPKDNCAGTFLYIKIFNRWGKEVFSSPDRKFRWYAENETPGVYYYSIRYSNNEYKGALSVRE